MRRIFLLLLFTVLSACQGLAPTSQPEDTEQANQRHSHNDSRNTSQSEGINRDGIPGTPLQPGERKPTLYNWVNYQLHIASLTRNQQEELWRILDRIKPSKMDDYARLQWAVIGLHYPPRRNLGQITASLEELEKSKKLNKDSQKYVRQLMLWAGQLQRQESEFFRLRQQLDEERSLKQELEEKIRKLTYIEETLNQRQRDREP